MLNIKNLTVFRDSLVLKNIQFNISKGQLFAIIGKSGVGKSTLLQAIAGLIPTQSGKIVLNHKELQFADHHLIHGFEEIVLMNQHFALDLYHTVYENIKNGCRLLEKNIQKQWVDELLSIFDLFELSNKKAHSLSGGEQQRLAFAVALAKEPDVLLLDEPFTNIDIHLRERILDFILLLKKRQKTSILFVTHNGQEALHISDKILYLNNQQIERIAKPEEFYHSPKNEVEAAFFGKINVLIIQRKKFIFRPNQYQTDSIVDSIELDIQFKQKHFMGVFSYFEYQYKRQKLYVVQKNDVILQRIYISKKLENHSISV